MGLLCPSLSSVSVCFRFFSSAFSLRWPFWRKANDPVINSGLKSQINPSLSLEDIKIIYVLCHSVKPVGIW